MPEDSRAKDPASVWKGQPEESRPVSVEIAMNGNSRALAAATRSEVWISIGAALFFAAAVAWRLLSDQYHLPAISLAAIVAWALISAIWFRKLLRGPVETADAKAVPGLTHYRRELERRRDHLRNLWLWHGPMVLACVVLAAVWTRDSVWAAREFMRVLPLLVLLLLWTVWGYLRRRGQARELQQELDELARM